MRFTHCKIQEIDGEKVTKVYDINGGTAFTVKGDKETETSYGLGVGRYTRQSTIKVSGTLEVLERNSQDYQDLIDEIAGYEITNDNGLKIKKRNINAKIKYYKVALAYEDAETGELVGRRLYKASLKVTSDTKANGADGDGVTEDNIQTLEIDALYDDDKGTTDDIIIGGTFDDMIEGFFKTTAEEPTEGQ